MSSTCPSPLDALAGVHFDNTIGALLIALIICALLTGIGSLQTFLYFTVSAKRDNTALRGLVAFLWILDVLATAFGAIGVYTYVITNYANPAALPIINWSTSAYTMVGGIGDFCVRCVFIYRIWLLSKMRIIPCGIMAFNFVVLAFSFVIAATYIQVRNFFELDGITWKYTLIFSLIAFTDTLIAIILCGLLWRRKRGLFQRTDSQIDILMAYSIHTGALTSLFGIAVLTAYLTMPNNLIYVGIYVIVPKLYHNALLASLNGRETILRCGGDESKGYNSIHLSSILPGSSVGGTTPSLEKTILNISSPSVHGFHDTGKKMTVSGSLSEAVYRGDEHKDQQQFV
ncbi:hypothetical protein ABKN59_004919 [Abortiporus biennis]